MGGDENGPCDGNNSQNWEWKREGTGMIAQECECKNTIYPPGHLPLCVRVSALVLLFN